MKKKKKEPVPLRYQLLFMTLFCIGAIFFSLTLNISGGPLHSLAGYVFVPMQKGINSSGAFLSDVFTDLVNIRNLQTEKEELESEVEELNNQISELKLESYEMEEYKELADLDSGLSDYQKVAATVIARDSGFWFSDFTIDKGSGDGIEPGMNVVSGTGLVGIVTSVGSNYASVRALIDDTANTSGMVSSTKDNIIVSGNLQSMTEEKVIPFSNLSDPEGDVKVGDPVVTSYISDEYHPGILIGYVSEITRDANNLTLSGTITPAVDFEHISHVLVITDIKETGRTETEEEEQ